MAIEIANLVQAMAQVTVDAGVPTLRNANGISGVRRTGAGRFELDLEEAVGTPTPTDPADVMVFVTCSSRLLQAAVAGERVVFVEFDTGPGVATDPTLFGVLVVRFPTVS